MKCTVALVVVLTWPCLCADAMKLRGHKHRMAVCLSGTARTLTNDEVADSLKTFMAEVAVPGFHSKTQPDLFAYLALGDQVSYSCRDTVNASRATVRRVLDRAGATNYTLVDMPNETTDAHVGEFLGHKDECFTEGVWALPLKGSAALSQIIHMQKCLGLVIEEESKFKRQYDVVVIARPDLIYWSPFPEDFLSDVFNNDTVVHDSDHFIAMPRHVANGLVPKGRKLVDCAPGMKCCGKANRVEDLLEFLLGVSVAHAGNCQCAESYTPSRSKKGFDIYGDYYKRAR